MSAPIQTPGDHGSPASGLKWGLIGLGSLMLINTFGLQSLVPLILPFVLIVAGVKMGKAAAH